MLWFLISFAYLWVYEGDSLYKGFSKGSVISGDSVTLGSKIEAFEWVVFGPIRAGYGVLECLTATSADQDPTGWTAKPAEC